uniref:Uncharacterized protein n=1 Tax=Knipowitschia caucasica TaxID=637954 RepID=A0AAV2K0U4_KNICA
MKKYKHLMYFLLMGGAATLCMFLLQPQDDRHLQTQEQRKNSLQEMCGFQDNNPTLEHLTSAHLRQFIVDDKHNLIYCFIPKLPRRLPLAPSPRRWPLFFATPVAARSDTTPVVCFDNDFDHAGGLLRHAPHQFSLLYSTA